MARGSRGPANDPLTMLQQQIDQLTDRVRELETKRVLSAPVNSLDKTRDPVDGEHMVDHRDGSAMWRLGDEWRYGLPVAAVFSLPQVIPFTAFEPDREYQLLDFSPETLVFQSSELFYFDDDFPNRMYVQTPGTYMCFLTVGQATTPDDHSFLQISVDGQGLKPDGLLTLGSNNWFTTDSTLMSAGDPVLSPTVEAFDTMHLSLIKIISFQDFSESILDDQYAEDNPDDDEEVPYPSYTRWFTASVKNNGPNDVTVGSCILTVIRISNRQLA